MTFPTPAENRQVNTAGIVLLCNAGSTSLKLLFTELPADKTDPVLLNLSGVKPSQFNGSAVELEAALMQHLSGKPRPRAVVHRIVHAGRVKEQAARLTPELTEQIAHWAPLAPLHNPLALKLTELVDRVWPGLPQYAIFDSGLYHDLPEVAARYALPEDLSSRWPLRRYGFHGLAHRNQWRQVHAACSRANLPVPVRLLTLQLGGGCSLTAWSNGKVLDTTMGFTPMEGLVMATRSGSVDPGLLLHLLGQEKLTPDQLQQLLATRSGLAAVGAGNGDIRELLKSPTPEATLAVEHYCRQIRKAIGAAVALLGGLDAISFGGGVGENQPLVRQMILADFDVFGCELNLTANLVTGEQAALHASSSKVSLWLSPVNEMQEMFGQFVAVSFDQEHK